VLKTASYKNICLHLTAFPPLPHFLLSVLLDVIILTTTTF